MKKEKQSMKGEFGIDEAKQAELQAKSLSEGRTAKTMSVPQMAKLLGLHKTDSYWLVHKNFFKTVIVAGQMRVDIESFEKWYASQVKYQKVNGDPPGANLREESYDAQDIGRMLGIPADYVYELMKLNNVPYITVDHWKRWTKEEFLKWYNSQSRYRMKPDREADAMDENRSMSLPEMAWLLGVPRNTVYSIISKEDPDNELEIIIVGDRKRVIKNSFHRWYKKQSHYRMVYETIEEAQKEKAKALKEDRLQRYSKEILNSSDLKESHHRMKPRIIPEMDDLDKADNPNKREYTFVSRDHAKYLSVEEVAQILKLKPSTIRYRIRNGTFPAENIAGHYRISKLEFSRWLREQDKR